MSGLVGFLFFAAFFYFMMRFGCGAHVGHGGHHRDHSSPNADFLASGTDPVCGMHVDAGAGYASMHDGAQARFCSRECLEKFDAAPEKYANQPPHLMAHGDHST
ncbi:YHS domain-containing protein [Pseudolysobacter antarcticus]|jgi:YHS domain-containing protein|uniref:YHS domain-containing protein n=1 Tax=Pseudolysobacter antarcticus TaxID=2511995 RepID=A0A411HJS7_9GAMM|nr:YHS domain-containing protein [Pseudolysobacter antarcticus]QBB70731.1 YHS domain-containing protein [Pseudolysobacter antarcticus]